MGQILQALANIFNSIASRIPWYKVAEFASWGAKFISKIASLSYNKAYAIMVYVSNNQSIIFDKFIKGLGYLSLIEWIMEKLGL